MEEILSPIDSSENTQKSTDKSEPINKDPFTFKAVILKLKGFSPNTTYVDIITQLLKDCQDISFIDYKDGSNIAYIRSGRSNGAQKVTSTTTRYVRKIFHEY